MPISSVMNGTSQELIKLLNMFHSLGRAALVFNKEGICGPDFSPSCLEMFEAIPSQKKISQVLKIPNEKLKNFENWCDLVFQEKLSFEEMVKLGPNSFSNSIGLFVNLEYQPYRDKLGTLIGVIVIASQMHDEVSEVNEVIPFNKELFLKFVHYTKEALKEMSCPKASLQDFLRLFHRIKGDASIFDIKPMMETCVSCENFLRTLTDNDLNKANVKTIMEFRNKLEQELDLFIELKK